VTVGSIVLQLYGAANESGAVVMNVIPDRETKSCRAYLLIC
jgi:hypothetical protein